MKIAIESTLAELDAGDRSLLLERRPTDEDPSGTRSGSSWRGAPGGGRRPPPHGPGLRRGRARRPRDPPGPLGRGAGRPRPGGAVRPRARRPEHRGLPPAQIPAEVIFETEPGSTGRRSTPFPPWASTPREAGPPTPRRCSWASSRPGGRGPRDRGLLPPGTLGRAPGRSSPPAPWAGRPASSPWAARERWPPWPTAPESVPRVEAIVGPGNQWVTEAKRQVAGELRIDSPAGPSEVLVVAGPGADPERVAAELMAQAEHDPRPPLRPSPGMRSSWSASGRRSPGSFAAAPRREIAGPLAERGGLLLARDRAEALAFAEAYAAEHLAIYTDDPRGDLDTQTTAGTVFLGEASHGGLRGLRHRGQPRAPHLGAVPGLLGTLGARVPPLLHLAGAHPPGRRRPAEDVGSWPMPRGFCPRTPRMRGLAAQTHARPAHEPLSPEGLRPLEPYAPDRRPVEVDLSDNTSRWGVHPGALAVIRGRTRRSSPLPPGLRRPAPGDGGPALHGCPSEAWPPGAAPTTSWTPPSGPRARPARRWPTFPPPSPWWRSSPG
jgi:hypothetical protein